MTARASTTPPSPITFDDDAQDGFFSQPSRWAMVGGIAVIALQLLTLDMVIERHARQAQIKAANYVTVTLQPRLEENHDLQARAPSALLVAGN